MVLPGHPAGLQPIHVYQTAFGERAQCSDGTTEERRVRTTVQRWLYPPGLKLFFVTGLVIFVTAVVRLVCPELLG